MRRVFRSVVAEKLDPLRDVRGPTPIRFGHAYLLLVSPPRPDKSCATGREPAPPTHRFPHGLEIACQSLAREQRVDPSVAIGGRAAPPRSRPIAASTSGRLIGHPCPDD